MRREINSLVAVLIVSLFSAVSLALVLYFGQKEVTASVLENSAAMLLEAE